MQLAAFTVPQHVACTSYKAILDIKTEEGGKASLNGRTGERKLQGGVKEGPAG